MKLGDFAALIRQMPTEEHAFWAWRKTWLRHIGEPTVSGTALARVFSLSRDPLGVKVSRGDIRKFGASGDLPAALMAALVWGYPGGMRGGYAESVCNSLESIVDLIQPCLNSDIADWEAHYSATDGIRGLGLSTYSKFLAFLPVSVGGNSALILDEVVARVAGDERFEELDDLVGLSYETAPARYPEYLRCMAAVARDLGASPEQLEMFLFAFGRNLKSPGS